MLRSALAAVLAAVPLIVLGGVGAPPARAESLGAATARQQRLLGEVDALQHQVDAALAAYDRSLTGLAGSVSARFQTEADLEAARSAGAAAADRLRSRVRALYQSGGAAGLYASVLGARTPAEAMDRLVYVRHVVASDAAAATAGAAAGTRAAQRADAARAAAATQTARAVGVAAAAARLQTLLSRQQALLTAADTRVAALTAAVRARQARLRAARAAAARAARDRVATVGGVAGPPSAAYLSLYHAAAATCPGLSWTILAAVGQVESGHGRRVAISPAGAQGPMQFLPSTFAAYAVDGNGDGVADIGDPADAIFTAAHYLCANGAGGGGAGLSAALWHYNHADWYVALVLAVAAGYH